MALHSRTPVTTPGMVEQLPGPTEPSRRGRFLRPAWQGAEGVRHLLIVSTPLIISNASNSLNLFFDRFFLSQYSKEAFAAALQAGAIHWTLMALFAGLVGYAGTFIAQYVGARRPERVGPALWQGLYLAVGSGVVAALLYFPAPAFFHWVGHEGTLPRLETQFFQVFALGSMAFLIKDGLACFYTGRGKTAVVMAVNIFICCANIGLNRWLIFHPPAPLPGGVRGSALSSVLANSLGAIVFAVLIFQKRYDVLFQVQRGWRPDWGLLGRLLRFGLPAGAHMLIDMIAFSAFMLVVGKFGFEAQFASNVALNINFLLFIPAIGFAEGARILAGQFAGARKSQSTERLASGALLLSGIYMAITCFLYAAMPDLFATWFRGSIGDAEWEAILRLSRILLLIVAAYSMFDAVNLAISGILKGSGDTKFVMVLSMFFSQVLLTGPCLALVAFRGRMDSRLGLLLAWIFCSAYIVFLAAAFLLRYWWGKWKTLQVIEDERAELMHAHEAVPLPISAPANEASKEVLPF